MKGCLRSLLLAQLLLAGAVLGLSPVLAQTAATPPVTAAPAAAEATPKGPSAGFVAPAEPKSDDSNAARAKSQPGNNAPFWRAVRESGNSQGISNLPGNEKGTLIQSFVQYPGSSFTSAGEAWRQVRNRWIIPYGGALLLIVLGAITSSTGARGRWVDMRSIRAASLSASRPSSAPRTGPMQLPSACWRFPGSSWLSASTSCCR